MAEYTLKYINHRARYDRRRLLRNVNSIIMSRYCVWRMRLQKTAYTSRSC